MTIRTRRAFLAVFLLVHPINNTTYCTIALEIYQKYGII